MDVKTVISKLHPLERKVVPVLQKEDNLEGISAGAGLDRTETMRALQWLENKGALRIEQKVRKVVVLDKNGESYKGEGLPEVRLFAVLGDDFLAFSELRARSKLSQEEATAAVGILLREKACESGKGAELMLRRMMGEGKAKDSFKREGWEYESPAALFLRRVFPVDLSDLSQRELEVVEQLRRRKGIIRIDEKKEVVVVLSALGEALSREEIRGDVVNRLTPAMLRSGEWREREFRAYDIGVGAPRVHGARVHFTNEAINYIRSIWLEMGFCEMRGDFVQSAFWDLDALFVPQDHPAREMQDTFYLEGRAKLPRLLKQVMEVHENGGSTGSRGWGYRFSVEESERVLLRTHTTVLSARVLANLKKEDLPAKFFAVAKVFRNEVLDWKHLFEFDQVEGVVVDQKATLAHLKGYLQEFYSKMGYSRIRMRPAHFPYTEPSLEVDVFHPIKKEWVELGGAGIFRPEVVRPLLGFDCKVLAWGQGMGRIISEYWNITDIRELYANDLSMIREAKLYLK